MCHSIPHASHLPPRDFRMRFREISMLVAYACSGFAKRDEVQNHRLLSAPVPQKFRLGNSANIPSIQPAIRPSQTALFRAEGRLERRDRSDQYPCHAKRNRTPGDFGHDFAERLCGCRFETEIELLTVSRLTGVGGYSPTSNSIRDVCGGHVRRARRQLRSDENSQESAVTN
jgi:hypothetical protein